MKSQVWKLTGQRSQDSKTFKHAAKLLKAGEVGVLPTDTLYGIVGPAFDRGAVEKIYRLRRRQPAKPFIVLVSSIKDLKLFGVEANRFSAGFLAKVWPGKVSAVLPCEDEELEYLHRGTNSLAFRLPDDRNLRALLKETGPLVAPSANLEGLPEAVTVLEAERYFGKEVAFYIDGGKKVSPPSTLIRFADDQVEVLREGAVKIV